MADLQATTTSQDSFTKEKYHPSISEPIYSGDSDTETIIYQFFTDDDSKESLLLDAALLSQEDGLAWTPMASSLSLDTVAPFFKSAGVTLPLSELCNVISRSQSLQQAKIMSVDCYSEWTPRLIKHRFLLFCLERPNRARIWLRVDRRPAQGTPLASILRTGGVTLANDTSQISAEKSELLRGQQTPENGLSFSNPPTLGTFRFFLQIIVDEILIYQAWPQNCWFFCSLIQEHLAGSNYTSLLFGSIPYPDLARKIRLRVYERAYHITKPAVTLTEKLERWNPLKDAQKAQARLLALLYKWNDLQFTKSEEFESLTKNLSDIVWETACTTQFFRDSRSLQLDLQLEAAKLRRGLVGHTKSYLTHEVKTLPVKLRRQGRLDEAIIAAYDVIRLALPQVPEETSFERSIRVAGAFNSLGECFVVAERFAEAISPFQEAFRVYRLEGLNDNAVNALKMLAVCQARTDDLDAAITSAIKRVAICKLSVSLRGTLLSDALWALLDLLKTARRFEEMLNIASEYGDVCLGAPISEVLVPRIQSLVQFLVVTGHLELATNIAQKCVDKFAVPRSFLSQYSDHALALKLLFEVLVTAERRHAALSPALDRVDVCQKRQITDQMQSSVEDLARCLQAALKNNNRTRPGMEPDYTQHTSFQTSLNKSFDIILKSRQYFTNSETGKALLKELVVLERDSGRVMV